MRRPTRYGSARKRKSRSRTVRKRIHTHRIQHLRATRSHKTHLHGPKATPQTQALSKRNLPKRRTLMPVLRKKRPRHDTRPRRAQITWRTTHMGQRCNRVQAMQPPKSRTHPSRSQNETTQRTCRAKTQPIRRIQPRQSRPIMAAIHAMASKLNTKKTSHQSHSSTHTNTLPAHPAHPARPT